MLTFCAITPHPPLLIPTIGKDELAKVEKTISAMEELEKDLYVTKPDTIVVISPHASLLAGAFVINAHPKFESDFEQFGDFATKKEWAGHPALASTIKQSANEANIPVQLISQEKLDHGTTVPLYFLTQHLPNVKIISIGFCSRPPKNHLRFGEIIKDVIMEHEDNIAVIASGDLSHGLATDAPAGFSKVGQEFDEKIIELLENNNAAGIANMDPAFIDEAAECGYRSILILLGIIKNMNYNFKNYSYEGPFGVGYLVGNFVL